MNRKDSLLMKTSRSKPYIIDKELAKRDLSLYSEVIRPLEEYLFEVP